MKITFLVVLIAINCSYSQNILDYFGIKEIKQIEISFAPNMNIDHPANNVAKTTKDSIFLNSVNLILSQLPAEGSICKDFPQNIPTWKIEIIDQDNQSHELIFYGVKLQSPNNRLFYYGLKHGESEKKLYLAIRSQMIGDWYNCE